MVSASGHANARNNTFSPAQREVEERHSRALARDFDFFPPAASARSRRRYKTKKKREETKQDEKDADGEKRARRRDEDSRAKIDGWSPSAEKQFPCSLGDARKVHAREEKSAAIFSSRASADSANCTPLTHWHDFPFAQRLAASGGP